MQLRMRSLCNQHGVGLIEVLISLLIIAIGVLGMVALHNRSLQYNHSAYVHSQATLLAADMLDRIQANSQLAKTGSNYQASATDFAFSQCLAEEYPNRCEAGSCTTAEIAAYDILQWKFQLACQIPGSQGTITYLDSGGLRTYTVRLSFVDASSRFPQSDVVLRSVL